MSDQPLPPTAAASQHNDTTSRVSKGLSPEPTERQKKRKSFYYRNLEPNNKNKAQPNKARNARGVQRDAHEQQTQSSRPSRHTRSDLQGRTVHAQDCLGSERPPMASGGALYTGQIAHITNVHYHITQEQVGFGSAQSLGLSHAPSQFQRVVPSQLQGPRSISATIGLPLVAHGAHGQAVGSQGRPQPQTQVHQQAFGAASAVAQQQGLNFTPRLSASSGHSHFPLVGVAIAPPLSISPEPRPITRTQTMPARTLELSRSC